MSKPVIAYTLQLTQEEAEALIALTGAVTGDPRLTKPYTGIYFALNDAGLPSGLSARLSISGATLPTITLPLPDFPGFKV